MHSLWPQVETFYPQLWRAVCGYERNPALRDELMQEVLLAVWESLSKLREPDRLLPFVLRIAHNLGASHVRSSMRTPALVEFDTEMHESLSRASDSEAERARTQWLFEVLATLPVSLRQPLMLQLEGFDYQEIADMLGISPDNVGVRIHRARERLKNLSRQEDADELR